MHISEKQRLNNRKNWLYICRMSYKFKTTEAIGWISIPLLTEIFKFARFFDWKSLFLPYFSHLRTIPTPTLWHNPDYAAVGL